jgi:hypothetical protein
MVSGDDEWSTAAQVPSRLTSTATANHEQHEFRDGVVVSSRSSLAS